MAGDSLSGRLCFVSFVLLPGVWTGPGTSSVLSTMVGSAPSPKGLSRARSQWGLASTVPPSQVHGSSQRRGVKQCF